jgi:DNA-binding GntR family transcriptional regulator
MTARKNADLVGNQEFSNLVDRLTTNYKTVSQTAYAVLREAILSGTFAAGEWLRQESLAEAIGVSRIPIRTALLQLESEGMVTFHPHRGARVRTLTPSQIDEIYRMRTVLEGYALGRAGRNVTPQRLAALRQLAGQLDDATEGGAEFLRLRIRFYRTLYDADNNPLLVETIDDLRSRVGHYYLTFKFPDTTHQHTDLVERLAADDLDGAHAWLTSHFNRIRLGIRDLASGDDSDTRAHEFGLRARESER